MAVGDCLSLHRQLHLDACFCFCVEDGNTHALLYSCSKHGGRSDQITPGRRAGDGGERGGWRETEREEERVTGDGGRWKGKKTQDTEKTEERSLGKSRGQRSDKEE